MRNLRVRLLAPPRRLRGTRPTWRRLLRLSQLLARPCAAPQAPVTLGRESSRHQWGGGVNASILADRSEQ
jgi:hypothetical protein